MAEQKKCAHPSCTCKAAPNSDYCSDECRDSRGATPNWCACGHPGCAAVATSTSGAPTY